MNAIDACYQMYKDLDKMITEKIKRIQCDKTFRAKITGQISADKYKIFYKNKECTVTCDGSVNVGDWVWVCAPCNNWDDLYIQLGRSMQNQINKTNSNLTTVKSESLKYRSTINWRGDMTLLGIYYSDPATTWDMPTTDQPYLLLQLGTKGTQWNIPVLAFGLYTSNMYRCLRKSTNGTDYENTQWAQVQ